MSVKHDPLTLVDLPTDIVNDPREGERREKERKVAGDPEVWLEPSTT